MTGPRPRPGRAGSLAQSYAASGFGRRLGFGVRSALVVVDLVNAYLVPDSPLYAGVDDALEATRRLLDAARAAAVPVIFTKVVYQPGGSDGGHFFRKAAALGLFVGETPLGEIADMVRPRPDEVVIRKQYASAFFGTSLASLLTSTGVDTVLLAGLSTSGCIRATAVDAVQHGFVPVVVREAVGDRDPGPHEAALFDLAAKYADVVDLDEVLEHLSGSPS